MDENLIRQAMAGDETAAKIYCGSYMLVQTITGRLFRHKGETAPRNHYEVKEINGESVYDKDGFLLDKYWALPRTTASFSQH